MYSLKYSKKFKKDLKKILKSYKFEIKELEEVLEMLRKGKKLSPELKNHKLKGNFSNCFECHVKSDILLVYKIKDNELIILLLRLGSHSDIFG